MDWREFVPDTTDLPPLSHFQDAGFPTRMLHTSKQMCEGSPSWAVAERWWSELDQHLKVPRGLAIWNSTPKALETLCLVTLRLSFWRYLPVPRGIRVAPAMYVEAMDLNDDDVAIRAREAGTLLVAGTGAVMYGADRTLEVLSSLAQIRLRQGNLTLWHLSPAATDRSEEVCRKLVKVLGDSTIEVGRP